MKNDTELTNPPRYAHWRNVEAIWPTLGNLQTPISDGFFDSRHLTNVQARTLDAISRNERALVAEQARSLKYSQGFYRQRGARRVYQVLALLGWTAVVVMGVWG